MTKRTLTIIAIDGPAGVGKTSVSKRIAEELGYYFFSSGLIYRVIAWQLLKTGWHSNAGNVLEHLGNFALSIGEGGVVVLNETPITADLHDEAISKAASELSALIEIRTLSNQVQKDTVTRIEKEGTYPGVVLEGRDIGTVVFPDANRKIFLTASEKVRAERRILERSEVASEREKQAVQSAIRERDERDQTRAIAPLKPAEDAHVIDTGSFTLEEVVQKVLGILKS